MLIYLIFMILSASDDNEKEEDQVPAGESTPENINNPVMTPKPVRALICGEKGNSSVVKYKITATPGYVCVIITTCSSFMFNIFHASQFVICVSALLSVVKHICDPELKTNLNTPVCCKILYPFDYLFSYSTSTAIKCFTIESQLFLFLQRPSKSTEGNGTGQRPGSSILHPS